MSDLWQPLGFSILIAGAATVLVCIVGISLAYFSAHTRFFGKSLLEALLTIPLVLPPTVVGYFLLEIFGGNGWIGPILSHLFHGYTIVFRPEAGILAAAVVSLPLLYLPAKSAFAAIDQDLEDTARLLGANRLQIFWHVSLPLARGGIASGVLLAFARALGEFGATTMVMGNIQGQQTLPIYIYTQTTAGDLHSAGAAVWTLSAISLLVVLLYNRSPVTGRSDSIQ
jgi:molybdate transport system permease protein